MKDKYSRPNLSCFTLVALVAIPLGLSWDGNSLGQETERGIYLGVKAPGTTSEPFATEFFSRAGEQTRFGIAITDDGRECYFAVGVQDGNGFREEIRFSRYEDGKWSAPKPLLSDTQYNYVDPHLSPDQNRLYFIYTKPHVGTVAQDRPVFDIWYVNRQGDGWGDPINLGSPISTEDADEYFVSLTADRTIYFGSNRVDRQNFDLYAAKLNDAGEYNTPELLRGGVNTPKYEADVFVSPDESYIIYCSLVNVDGNHRGDLYISFRNDDETWGEPINMGKQVNSDAHEFAPSVSRNGKYLFFSRGGVIHWVDSSMIEDLRKK